MTVAQVISRLQDLSDAEKVTYKAKRFGIVAHNALGIYQKDLNELARQIKKDSMLAVALFDTNIYEARILCSKIFHPNDLTTELMESWVATFENWEICDAFSMGLFAKSRFAVPKAIEWADRIPEFEKRASFATIASYCMADKKASNEVYEPFIPLIKAAATDDRIYVKKAVNWALRSIGKRNRYLQQKAITAAYEILTIDNKAAQWIAKNAIKELESSQVNMLDYPRSIYRPKP
jgi:3-methyladenine DNA glycosylase AlkD